MSAARYLIVVLVTFCGLLILAALNAWLQSDAPTKNGYYTCSYIRAKIARGSTIASPKLVIASGSNATAGISVPLLDRDLSIRAFNFGLSASFGPGFQLFEASKIVRPGDAVLMPLEYLAYDYSTPRSSLVDAVYTCGTDYWRSLDWRDKLFFAIAVRPWRILDSLWFRRRAHALAAVASQAESVVGPYGQGTAAENGPRTMTTSGEAVASHDPLDIHLDPDSSGAEAIRRFVAWAHRHQVTVFATWPTTLYYPQYENYPAFARIRAFYRGLGVTIVGTPEDSMYPIALMGDTIYHLNRAGMEVNTTRLIRSLRADPAFLAWQRAGAAR
ncbi:MAG TPA: hypothetical protein VH020_08535 [Stellaceae bacterium]|nr:hypothetical protein [Stellaceae bacterium]